MTVLSLRTNGALSWSHLSDDFKEIITKHRMDFDGVQLDSADIDLKSSLNTNKMAKLKMRRQSPWNYNKEEQLSIIYI